MHGRASRGQTVDCAREGQIGSGGEKREVTPALAGRIPYHLTALYQRAGEALNGDSRRFEYAPVYPRSVRMPMLRERGERGAYGAVRVAKGPRGPSARARRSSGAYRAAAIGPPQSWPDRAVLAFFLRIRPALRLKHSSQLLLDLVGGERFPDESPSAQLNRLHHLGLAALGADHHHRHILPAIVGLQLAQQL